ncbi:NodT family efflux transporter outer membrane factor (OMF) lipoprotein [Algoriphagus sp. 4150]|uniref:efflux transporter outer membrane subunit n=1 Tax=Algoriphagus sp. 4150 TaxID=2817756 RepID=UPI00285B0168|nr:efflux transporter outer membrane subunit [Algoriphagus sp. 4150]MDR7129308.1 NodT family efflux transporter outer membrane factor (OMF) lipoprotein [Algoriphagus sp. 4150]
MNHTKRLLPIFIMLLAAVSCKVGENYTRPDLDLPEEYYGGEKLQDSVFVGENEIATINWKEFFKDSTLNALIDAALAGNFDMQKVSKQIEIANEGFLQSKANFLPSLGANPAEFRREYFGGNFNNYGSNRSRRNHGENIPKTFYTENLVYAVSLQSSWEIDIWGKLRWQKDAALAEYMQSREFKKAVQTALVAEIASTYFNILMLKSQMTVAKRNYDLSLNTLKVVNLQYEAGENTALAIQQTESQMLRAKSLIPQLEKAYAIQENKLNNLLGRSPQEIEYKGVLDQLALDSSYSTGVPLELIQNRPDVAASELDLVASNARVGINKAMRYPSLSINASTGLNSMSFSNVFDPLGSGFAMINGALFQPIFQNRKLKTRHRIAIKEREIAEIDFKEKVTLAVTEVSSALVSIEKLEEEYTIAQERMRVTTKGMANAFLLFESGFANYLEIINAQEDALQNQLEVVQLKMQLILAKVELYRSLGGGWTAEEQEAVD